MVRLIRDGGLASGDRLPTSEALAERYGVSRGTARSAVDRLFGQGLIFKRGNSWYVEQRDRTH